MAMILITVAFSHLCINLEVSKGIKAIMKRPENGMSSHLRWRKECALMKLPTISSDLVSLGILANENGNYDDALKWYQKSLEIEK